MVGCYWSVMSDEIDLSGERDPTEVMVEQQEQQSSETAENHREGEYEGSEETVSFDVEDAVSRLSDDDDGGGDDA